MARVQDQHFEEKILTPIEMALGLLEGKWKCIILFQLLNGTVRFNELRRRLAGVTQRTLTNQLRDLERAGLIERRVYAQVPIRVEYKISTFGATLEPILRSLEGWGQLHKAQLYNTEKSINAVGFLDQQDACTEISGTYRGP